ncbi:DNA-directed RNA polymerase subunit 5 [Fadolivirus algeromassiliense]|jgi:DNA-directed RNA polymerase I, II, and III subunit RPABC1|uniref:DNA-directed RNA polymerase subunit 5 n=1 Tax=Fadolivirus FV1/VV64 TaxID=3070911 RepID=A0A7D3UVA5_9VIRU|nr:DNA-directed RNA polymerase subunit 5 [Fadolivirus algeromassiliense]QKF94069.1 DNA-directed RNA polymerase subunit 5 [Fadolivirus FV1/VV64]
MSTFKIFQIEKSPDDIRKTVLTNIVKMLTERNLINKENLEKNIETLLSTTTDDHTYSITLDNYKNNDDKIIFIKMFHQKISAISKQSGISDYLNKYKDKPKLIIVKGINTKAEQSILNNYPKTEIFLENELMINIIDNILVPRYEILDHETDDFKQFCELYNCKKRNIPKLYSHDPMAKYYNLKKGDIVRIIRASETAGLSSFYRIVI